MRLPLPFRDKPFTIPRRLYKAMLPAYAVICIAAISAWLAWALSLVKGGWQHVTAGEAFIFAGFAGIAGLIVFSTAVTVAIVESVLYEARLARNKELLDILAQLNIEPLKE